MNDEYDEYINTAIGESMASQWRVKHTAIGESMARASQTYCQWRVNGEGSMARASQAYCHWRVKDVAATFYDLWQLLVAACGSSLKQCAAIVSIICLISGSVGFLYLTIW